MVPEIFVPSFNFNSSADKASGSMSAHTNANVAAVRWIPPPMRPSMARQLPRGKRRSASGAALVSSQCGASGYPAETTRFSDSLFYCLG